MDVFFVEILVKCKVFEVFEGDVGVKKYMWWVDIEWMCEEEERWKKEEERKEKEVKKV